MKNIIIFTLLMFGFIFGVQHVSAEVVSAPPSETTTDSGSGNTNDITGSDFVIQVGQISPGGTELSGATTTETVNNVLLKFLEMLVIIFGVLAVFIMTVGAGYMIIYHGQDEFLSKGKTIFMSGIISLAVALSAGLMVRLLLFLLY